VRNAATDDPETADAMVEEAVRAIERLVKA